MALTFPLSSAVFVGTLRIAEVQFYRKDFIEISGLASGEVLTAQIAFSKWMARISLASMTHVQAAAAQALIEAIGPHQEFNLYDPRKQYPRYDHDGSELGLASPSIQSIGTNNRSLRIQGLPAGYDLAAGDFFSYSFSGRQALARIAEDVSATGAGLTPLFDVSGPLRFGTAVSQAVRLVKPFARMMFMPDTFDPGTGDILITSGMTFTAIESLR